jgi:2-aminoethylphosphonate--pyruvate transaminase
MDKKLFTPGPLTTSLLVKQSMLRDVGSRDKEFIETVKFIRQKLVDIADPDHSGKYTSILLPGSGTYAIESIFANVLGNTKCKALILSNGAYGDRMATICKQARYSYDHLKFPENDYLPLDKIKDHLKMHGQNYSLVSFVHCETSSGVINPLNELATLIKQLTNAYLFVDAMSSFGAVPLNVSASKIDFVVSSANKCLEGVPGFSYIICQIEALQACKGRCLSMSFDLNEQWHGLEVNGQFRFTPPTHSLLAFKRALLEYDEEGGLEGRRSRYMKNCEIIKLGMKQFGFQLFLDEKIHNSYIITSFFYPNDANFDFNKFYGLLSDRGHVLYPGKVISANCFRIGNIGRLYGEDCQNLLKDIEMVLLEMGVQMKRRADG